MIMIDFLGLHIKIDGILKDNSVRGYPVCFRSAVGSVHNLFIIYCNMKQEILLNVCIKVFSYNLSWSELGCFILQYAGNLS